MRGTPRQYFEVICYLLGDSQFLMDYEDLIVRADHNKLYETWN